MPLPTLRAILASDSVRAAQPETLAGGRRIDRQVRWVHVSEVREVAGLLSGGELILSTGLAMRGPGADAVAYLDDLISAGACGLFVELGPDFAQIPDDVLARARDRDFPLVALHQRARFVEITEQVHRAIVAEQYELLDFARRVHERFTALSLEGAAAQDIVEAAGDLAGSSVVLEDLSRHVVAHVAIGRPASGLLQGWEKRSRLVPALDHTGITGPEAWMTTPVGIQQRWGRLVVVNPASDQERLAMVLERAAQALELGRMAESDRASLAVQAQGGFLSDLADARVTDTADVDARARALGLPPSPPYVATVVRAAAGEAGDPMAAHRRSRRLVERVQDAARAVRLPVLVGPFGPDEVGVLAALGVSGDEGLTRFAETLHAQHARQPELDEVTVGAGAAVDSLIAAAGGLRHAQHVAEVATAMPSGRRRPFFRAADVRLHGLIALLHDDPRVQAFAESELDRLLVHEATHDDGMLELLRQYLAVNGSKTELARVSHRSRPALYKKLDQLERILGVCLDDADTRLSLGVALMARDQRRR
ncbi:purine catabolism regulator [Mumia flava]|uniref:Purine catabolism regulator n=1 Tax=Mumia flava TaxID=1348852 RepID=A0A0B2BP01_9ACTN|nr:PucR family transcriptional regulator ligand-binding domain-containing protein [Mumia flava]PJJ57967.1 purine catabolism regulator [Mumia flava]